MEQDKYNGPFDIHDALTGVHDRIERATDRVIELRKKYRRECLPTNHGTVNAVGIRRTIEEADTYYMKAKNWSTDMDHYSDFKSALIEAEKIIDQVEWLLSRVI